MLSTCPTRPGGGAGRHAADEPHDLPAPPTPSSWSRLLVSGADEDIAVEGDHVVARVRGLRPPLVVVVHLGACDVVDVRGFRAPLRLLDPPLTSWIICRSLPGRLALVPGAVAGADGRS